MSGTILRVIGIPSTMWLPRVGQNMWNGVVEVVLVSNLQLGLCAHAMSEGKHNWGYRRLCPSTDVECERWWRKEDQDGVRTGLLQSGPNSVPVKKCYSSHTRPINEEEVDAKPSVFIFIFDSVASSQALRYSMSLSIATPQLAGPYRRLFLCWSTSSKRWICGMWTRSERTVIRMDWRCCSGNNIRIEIKDQLFILGKLINDIDRSVFGMEKVQADWNETQACYRYLDDEQFILKEFTKVCENFAYSSQRWFLQKGYKSLMAEDWAAGVFNHPNCWGFKEAPVTHYMRCFSRYFSTFRWFLLL